MALEDNGGNGMIMPVAPFYGNGNGNNNGFGGDWAWIILLLLLGWGNNGNGFGGNGGFGGGFGGLFPWMNQSNQINDGFQNQLLNDNISGIRDSINNISTQLCNGFASVEQGANARQMADMQQMFALQSQFADCCCENRLANCQTQNLISNEANATRAADLRNTQAILDKLCQLELDNYKRENDQLRSDLTNARFAASQIQQTSDIQNNIVNELRSCPIPSQPVYGSQPIFTCNGNNGGCGCNGGF